MAHLSIDLIERYALRELSDAANLNKFSSFSDT